MTEAERQHANECWALLYQRLGESEEVMVVPQILNAAIRRGGYLADTWEDQW